jgi:two-component system, cell cycle sensor histidine kinase and response regulator CckA
VGQGTLADLNSTKEELAEQNRVLRERIAQLEGAGLGQVDPLVQALLENSPAYMNVVTTDGRFLATGRVNEAFGSVVGRSVFEFTEPSEHAVMREAFARVCATARPASYESVGYGENGEPGHTYVVRAVPVLDHGEVSALVLVPMDITERVNLERSLIESEQAMRLAVEAARMGLWRWDMLHDQITWDARTLEIFGVSAPPLNREQYTQLIHPDDRDLVQRMVETAQETGAYSAFEHRLVARPEAGERWLLAAGKVIKDASGRPALMLGGVLDITDQKRLTIQMQRAERVEALGQLTAGMAHNFNNLLAAILPNVELALLDAPANLRPQLSAALDASLQARELVKSLMSLAGRRGTHAREPSDPKEVVARLEAICKLTFPREIELSTSIDPLTGLVAMPASELEQVLLNLMLNARDAVLEGTGSERRIQVLVDRVGTNAAALQARIRVVDTGVGMSASVRAQVFEPFFTTKPPHRASGLGLADALSRVRQVDGRLECESSPGHGATFSLLLPEIPARAPNTRAPIAQAKAQCAVEAILLVDDEPLVRYVNARVLSSEGYEVLQAASAAEAREILRQQGLRVKLILLDQSMPAESGLEALPSLQKLCSAKVVLFTGLATAVPVGIAGLLEKPARPSELLQTVRQVLDASDRGA